MSDVDNEEFAALLLKIWQRDYAWKIFNRIDDWTMAKARFCRELNIKESTFDKYIKRDR